MNLKTSIISFHREFKTINLQKVLNKNLNFKLKSNDNVIVLSKKDLQFLKTTMLSSDKGDPEMRIKGLRHLIFKPETLARI